MSNNPPKDPRQIKQPYRDSRQDREYVVDGQYLNQGHYVNPNQDPYVDQQQINQDLDQAYYYDEHGYPIDPNQQAYEPQVEPISHHELRPEIVQDQNVNYEQNYQGDDTESNQAQASHAGTIAAGAVAAEGGTKQTSAPRKLSPIIPKNNVLGKSILFIIIAMCFLASISIVALLLVQKSVDGWTQDIGRQATAQITPSVTRNLTDDVNAALGIIRNFDGVTQAEPLSKTETAKLLEPWIGDGQIGLEGSDQTVSLLDELPIPALIAIELSLEKNVDLNALDQALKAEVPNISIDDHKRWLSHLSSIGNILKISAFFVLALVVAITATIIIFATDAALNSNKNSIEILFLVGAEERYIVREVRQHFLIMGLKAGLIGAAIAVAFILALGLLVNIFYAAQFENLAAARILFGQISLEPYQYLYLLLVPMASTAISSICVHLASKRIIASIQG